MVKPRLIWGVSAVVIVGTLALAGCAPRAELSSTGEADSTTIVATETGLMPLENWQIDPSMGEDDFLDAIYEGYDKRAAEYQPKVIEFEDGTKAQLTPSPERDSTAQIADNISYNLYRLDADNRGCQACHDNLADTVLSMGGTAHKDVSNTLGMDVTVSQCIDCHVTHLGGRYEGQFSGAIHTIHGKRNKMFEEKGGDCWSCHFGVTERVEFTDSAPDSEGLHLWEEVKHKVLRGINTLDAESFAGEFSVDQNYVEGPEVPLWSNNWIVGRDNEVSAVRWARWQHGDKPDPATDGVYDSWQITIDPGNGEVVTMSLREMIDKIGSETTVMAAQCIDNGPNGSYVTNREITGIPLQRIADYVGASDKSVMYATASDGNEYVAGMDHVREFSGYLVYEVSGQPLSYEAGYPCQMWIGNWHSIDNGKMIVDMTFSDDPWDPYGWEGGSVAEKKGRGGYSPNVGICYMHEGQIVNVGEELTFQGFATTYLHTVTDVEFSMDHGQTWQTFATPDQDPKKWTWWNFAYTPQEVGSYCLMVRAHDSGGNETPRPFEIMFNVVDGSEAK